MNKKKIKEIEGMINSLLNFRRIMDNIVSNVYIANLSESIKKITPPSTNTQVSNVNPNPDISNETKKMSLGYIKDYREKMLGSGVLGEPFTSILTSMSNLDLVTKIAIKHFPDLESDPEEDSEKNHIQQNYRDLKVQIRRFDVIMSSYFNKYLQSKNNKIDKFELNTVMYNFFGNLQNNQLVPDPDIHDWVKNSNELIQKMVISLKSNIPFDDEKGQFFHFAVQMSLTGKPLILPPNL